MPRFRYRAIGPDQAVVSDLVVADTRADALRRLARERKTVLEIGEERGDVGGGGKAAARVGHDERILVLRQLAVMVGARVELLEALSIIASSLAGRPVAECLRNTAAALRQGDRLAKALHDNAPFYPPYVYALIRAGESSGRLALVLDEATRQLDFERRVVRDVQNALVYPAFLVISGAASVAFLFYVVVPRFAEMLTNARANVSGFSAFIINAGVAFHDNAAAILIGIAGAAAGLAALANTAAGKRFFNRLAHTLPGLRTLMLTRERAAWSNIMSIALTAGVDLLAATSLAAGALPESKLKHDAEAALPALRAGRPIDEAFLKTNTLSVVDASLVRAGQRSGALGAMFRRVAERNDEDMRDALKRLTVIVEPLAIAVVAGMIGAIVLGLVSALVTIYDAIG